MMRMSATWMALCLILLCMGGGASWADTSVQATPNHDFAGGGGGDPFIPEGWSNAQGDQAFQPGELRLVADGDKRSLEINTLGKGAVTRKLYTLLEVEVYPNAVYEVAHTTQKLGGDGYVSISARQELDGSHTSFLAAIGNVDLRNWRGTGGFPQTNYRFNQHVFDCARPHLVIQVHGEASVVINEISIRPVKHTGWLHDEYQTMPWRRDWQRGVVSDEVTTPHTRWAKPYAGGELQVTTILPRPTHRWTVELSQRMSVAFRPVMLEASRRRNEGDYWVVGEGGDPEVFRYRQETLRGISQPADCLVLGYRSGSHVATDRVAAILAAVASGVGLVIIEPEAEGGKAQEYREGDWAVALNEGNLWAEGTPDILPGVVVGGEATFYRYGAGRIALLEKLPVPSAQEGLRGEFEAQISVAMKAIRWAGDRMPDVRMDRFTLPGAQAGALRAEVDRGRLPASTRVDLSAPLPAAGVLRWWLDDYESRRLPGGEVALAAGSTFAQIALPRLPGGEHWLHVQLVERDGRILDWNTLALQVSPQAAIESVALERDKRVAGEFVAGAYREGERLEGRVILDTAPEAGAAVRLRLADVEGHLWTEQTLAVAGAKEIAFSLDTPKAVNLMHRLEATLIGPDGAEVDIHTRHVAVARPDDWYRNTFGLHNWGVGTPRGYLGLLSARERARTHGVNVAYRGIARPCAYANIRVLPFTGQNQPGPGARVRAGTEAAPERDPCPNNPGWRSYAAAGLIEQVANAPQYSLSSVLPYAPLGYDIAHEVNLLGYGALSPGGARADICFCTHCLATLRAMMETEYGSLNALNQAWGTEFAGWDAVRPVVLDEAVTSGQIARWIDHRRHMDRVWTDAMKFKIDVVRRHDPDAWGVSDSFRAPTTWSGADYWQLGSECVAGHGPQRFFTPPERRHLIYSMVRSVWARSNMTPDDGLFRRRMENSIWGGDYLVGGLLAGARGTSRWLDNDINPHVGWFRSSFSPDLRITEEGRWDADAVAHIRTGLDRLVFESRRNDSGIALLYSRSSEHAATAWHAVVGGGDLADRVLPTYRFPALAPFTDALDSLGYGYSVVSEQQVAEGVLGRQGAKVLILGFAQALDVKTVSAIKEFVSGGGIVLADIRPAVADRHGRTGATGGLLDDVFGVAHETGWGDYRPTEKALALEGGASTPVMAGPSVRVTTAEARNVVDGVPMNLVNRHGQGRAVLLNYRPLQGDSQAARQVGRVLGWAGLEPLFAVEAIETLYPDYNRPSARAAADARKTIEGGVGDAAFYQPLDEAEASEDRPGLAHLQSKNIHVFGFWYGAGNRRGDGLRRLRVTAPAEGHIYDLLTNEYLGRHRQFEVEMPLEAVRVYAAAPYQIEAPALNVQMTRAESGHAQIVCQVGVSPAAAASEKHVVRMQLFAPDGAEWRDFNENVVVENGAATYRFLLPLNAPQGDWTIQAREAISGLSVTASVRGL